MKCFEDGKWRGCNDSLKSDSEDQGILPQVNDTFNFSVIFFHFLRLLFEKWIVSTHWRSTNIATYSGLFGELKLSISQNVNEKPQQVVLLSSKCSSYSWVSDTSVISPMFMVELFLSPVLIANWFLLSVSPAPSTFALNFFLFFRTTSDLPWPWKICQRRW